MTTEKNMQLNSSAKPVSPPVRRNRAVSRRWLPYGGGVVLVALIAVGLWPQPVRVETTSARVGRLRATVNEEGKTRVKQRYLVSAPVAGQLRRIPYKAGAEVRLGETVVAVIDPLSPAMLDARSRALAQARRDTAAANLEKARSALAFATRELRRVEQLYVEQVVPIQELEVAQWRKVSAAKEQAAAESTLRQAEAELADFISLSHATNAPAQGPIEIRAPAHGRVLHVFEESSRVVPAGTSLVEIGDPTDLEVMIEVLSRDGAAITPGTLVELEYWGGDQPLQARVRLVEPAAFTKISALGVEEQRVWVIADLLTPWAQRPGLGDNFRVEARIIVWEAERVLQVPSAALFRHGEQWAVYAVTQGRARLLPVHVGRSNGQDTQLLDGLQENDEVILYPGDRVRDGQRLKRIEI
jgi:HlyD family secretion protein